MLIFLFVSLIPVTLVQLFNYYYTVKVMERKVKEYAGSSLTHTIRNLRTELSAYEDLVYQVAYDDSLIELLAQLNDKYDAATWNKLQLKLNILSYSKKWINSLVLITENGDSVISIDRTGQDINNHFWQSLGDLTGTTFYRKSIELYSRNVWEGTKFLGAYGDTLYYSFFLSRRIIDFNTNRPLGVVVLSIGEPLLTGIYADQKEEMRQDLNKTFIVDETGRIISHPVKKLIGGDVRDIFPPPVAKQLLRKEDLIELNSKIFGKGVIVDSAPISKTGWRVVNIIDRDHLFREIRLTKNLILLIQTFAMISLILIAISVSKRLTAAVKKIVQAMLKAENGDLSVRVETDTDDEISLIAKSFNTMIEKIRSLVEEVKRVTQKEKEAEIKKLEMQINPHFLYNTLDSINWMAIEKGELEISESLKQLANILRYSVNGSNQKVTLRQESEWLRDYLALQKCRFSDSFTYRIAIDPELMDCWIHKLLLQPFIENAIIHGLAGKTNGGILEITGKSFGADQMLLTIRDNGKGMNRAKILSVFEKRENGEAGIGITNALSRLELYYGANYRLHVKSPVNGGTIIRIIIPKDWEGRETDANRCG
jgi:two-component system sensor histidine kinase YesM